MDIMNFFEGIARVIWIVFGNFFAFIIGFPTMILLGLLGLGDFSIPG
jgi:hypothetical protein